MYIATAISLLSIVSLYFIYKNFVDMKKVVNFGDTDAKTVLEILNRTIDSPAFLYPAISIITFVSINAGIAGYMFHKKVKGFYKTFAFSIMMFGGFGIPVIFLVITLFRNKEINNGQTMVKK